MDDEALFGGEPRTVDEFCSTMDVDDSVIEMAKDGGVAFDSEKGEASSVVFSRESPLLSKGSMISGNRSCIIKKHKSRKATAELDPRKKEKLGQEKKLNKQNRVGLSRAFQAAVSSRDWEHAESLIVLADIQTLNDALCIALDSIWFLSYEEELYGINGLIKKIVVNGAYDFTRAALRTSFLASCVSTCQSRTMSLTDTVTVMAQRCLIVKDIIYCLISLVLFCDS